MSKRIAIIGAGTAGLQLGLYLQQNGVESTIFTDRRPEEYSSLRLLNTVAHFQVTLERERQLGIKHWPQPDNYRGHYYYIGIPGNPLKFFGDHKIGDNRAVDYRVYQPQLMNDYVQRGGNIEYREIGPEDLDELSAAYELVVLCTGKSGLSKLFERDPASSPFTEPQRQLCVGLYKGVAGKEQRSVRFNIAPGQGEMIEFPTMTFNGDSTALVMENHIGGDMEILAKTRYDEDPEAFKALLLDRLKKYYPDTYDRIDEDEFDLANSSLDILQGGVTPTVRHGIVSIGNGKKALLLGDAHATVDPVLGQGANAASYAAIVVGEEIVKNNVFDERFFEIVNARRAERVLGASRWTNYMLTNLRELPQHFVEFLMAVAADKNLADEFTNNFNFPEKQWDTFSSPASMQAWIEEHSIKKDDENGNSSVAQITLPAEPAPPAETTPDAEEGTEIDFRKSVSLFATGIAVVTMKDEEDTVHGVTVNSFTSISLDPPTVMISLRPGRAHDLVSKNGVYGVSVLTDAQQSHSKYFTGKRDGDCTPEFTDGTIVPTLQGSLARFECRVTDEVKVHDHTLFLARVEHCEAGDGSPLMFYASKYHQPLLGAS